MGSIIFVETGEWREEFEYSSGDFRKGVSITETTYDSFGNILSRRVFEKGNKDKEFFLRETWSSQMQVFNSDTTLIQNIKEYNKSARLIWEINLYPSDYKEVLSDRLKIKMKVGSEKAWDDRGNLKKETIYKFEDKVRAN